MKRHVLISGTGRCGTTFLVQLLTALGLDTGFNLSENMVHSDSNAGLEWDIREPDAPFIVKSPWICEYLHAVLDKGEICVEHLIIPIRDLYAAAESRRDVMRRAAGSGAGLAEDIDVPGGLWGTIDPEDQESALLERFYNLLRTAARYDLPVTFLDFPRMVHQSEYLRQKLIPIFGLKKLRKKQFNEVFSLISRPDLVHEFKS